MSDQQKANVLIRMNKSIVGVSTNFAAWVLSAMMFLTFADVVLRYFFNSPILGTPEIISLMMSFVIPFSIVYCAQQKAHIAVDFIVERFSDMSRKIINCFISLMMIVLFMLITWQTFVNMFDEYGAELTTETLYIPIYPFILLAAIAFLILTFILLADFIGHLSEVISKWTRS